MISDLSYKTVFVQGIPTSCSNEQLNEMFSVVGPIKQAFVVPRSDEKIPTEASPKKQSCVGYVTYHCQNDAKSAVNSRIGRFVVDGVKVKVQFSRKKKFSKKNCTKSKEDASFEIVPKNGVKDANKRSLKMTVSKSVNIEPVAEPNIADEHKINGKELKYQNLLTSRIGKSSCVALSTSSGQVPMKSLKYIWKQKKLRKPVEFVYLHNESGSKDERTIYAIMSSKQDALKVALKLNRMSVDGELIKTTLLQDPDSKEFQKSAKKSRLIIRNLSFHCSEKELSSAFEKFGTITDCKIPKKADGKKRGFGFVQFSHRFEAENAIKAVNMTAIKGRTVAVDWTLPKEQYKETRQQSSSEKSISPDSKVKSNVDSGISEDESGDDENADEKQVIADDNDDDDDDDGDADASDDFETETALHENKNVNSDCDEDSDSEYGNSYQDSKHDTKNMVRNRDSSSDVHEGNTLFLRNISYDVDESELGGILEQFGELKYCKVVENKENGMSKGCAFVQFVKKSDAYKCLKMVNDESESLLIHGRPLRASVATSRPEARKLAKEKNESRHEKDDGRNLHLAYEGLIRPGTQAAVGLSEMELNKRQRIEQAKCTKLKNPNVFVSTTRLCVHNLPRAVDDAKLREIMSAAAGGGGGKGQAVCVVEARVMRDREKVNHVTGVARSLGFAFVAFSRHAEALRALRQLNNNPDVFGADKRPIVEFSLENRLALDAQQQRRQRMAAKISLRRKMSQNDGNDNIGNGTSSAAPTKKAKKEENRTSRGKKQREKARLKKAEKGFKIINASNKSTENPHLQQKISKHAGETSSKKRKGKKRAAKSANEEAAKLPKLTVDAEAQRKPFQGSRGTTEDGKKMKMPKHTGPKIRKRDKGKVLERLRQSKKLNKAARSNARPRDAEAKRTAQKRREVTPMMSQQSRRERANGGKEVRKDLKDDADFHKLVAKYAKQFKSSNGV